MVSLAARLPCGDGSGIIIPTSIDKKTVWLILRKKQKLHPYKQHDVLDLSDRKKEGRVEFRTWEPEQLTVLEDYL